MKLTFVHITNAKIAHLQKQCPIIINSWNYFMLRCLWKFYILDLKLGQPSDCCRWIKNASGISRASIAVARSQGLAKVRHGGQIRPAVVFCPAAAKNFQRFISANVSCKNVIFGLCFYKKVARRDSNIFKMACKSKKLP